MENKEIVRTAKELFEVTKSNEIPLENILSTCNMEAKGGSSCATIWCYLSSERILELLNLGFSVSKGTAPDSRIIHTVKWEQ